MILTLNCNINGPRWRFKYWSIWTQVHLCFALDWDSIVVSLGSKSVVEFHVQRFPDGVIKSLYIAQRVSFVPPDREILHWSYFGDEAFEAITSIFYHLVITYVDPKVNVLGKFWKKRKWVSRSASSSVGQLCNERRKTYGKEQPVALKSIASL